MRKIFIHIGYPKTATTTLQNFFYTNPELLKRHQLYYPEKGMALPEKGHHNITRSIPWNTVTANLYKPDLGDIDSLVKEIDKKKENVIISSEGFAHLFAKDAPKIDKYLKTSLKKYEIEYLIVVRKADEFIESSFFQRLNAWSRGRIKKQLPSIEETKIKHLKSELGYLRMVEKALQLDTKVTVLTYGSNIVNEIANYIIKSPVTVPKTSINKRQSKKLLSLIYILSSHKQQADYQRLFMENRKKIIRAFTENETEKYGIFTLPERLQLMRKYTKKINEINIKYHTKIAIPKDDKSEKGFFLVNDFNKKQLRIVHSIFGIELKKMTTQEIIKNTK